MQILEKNKSKKNVLLLAFLDNLINTCFTKSYKALKPKSAIYSFTT